jgi:polysaccharide biosynthesis/export protein VpsN
MKTLFRCFFFWLALVGVAVAQSDQDREFQRSYRLATGDVISISVYGQKDLSLTTKVGASGKFAYPLLGDIKVASLTVSEVEDVITKGLKGPYLVDPKVSVTVESYRPFSVGGEVNKPGSYPYSPGLTVQEALTLAGGLAERASKRKIFLIREKDKGRENYKGKRVKMDTRVGPGDILTVEQSFF